MEYRTFSGLRYVGSHPVLDSNLMPFCSSQVAGLQEISPKLELSGLMGHGRILLVALLDILLDTMDYNVGMLSGLCFIV